MKKLPSLLSVFILMLALCGSALGQTYQNPLAKTVGPFLDLHGNGNFFNATKGSATLGGGFGGKIGIGFTRFSLYTGVNFSSLKTNQFSDNYKENDLAYFEWQLIGSQYHFRTNNPALIPYAEFALSLIYFTPPKGSENF